jgi:uncharacterized delta-60 repeat protein
MQIIMLPLFTLLISMFLSSSLGAKEQKVAPELRTIWQKAYGGENRDRPHSVIATKDGGAFIAGSSRSYGKGRNDMLVIRMDKKGNILYRSSFGGKKQDYAHAITATSDGHYMVAGSSTSFSKYGDKDVYVVKFDIDGKRLWQKRFGGDRHDEALSITATRGGGALVVGSTESYGQGYKDVYILYIDKEGKEIWSKAIGGRDDDIAHAITLSADGGFYVAGTTRSYGAGGFDFYLLKFNGKGKLVYDKVYGEEKDDKLYAITATRDGGCVVTGSTHSFGSKHNDIDVIRYGKNGKTIWHKVFGFDSKEWGNAIVAMPSGGFLIAGTTKSFGFGSYDFYLLELNAQGSSVWANVYGGKEREEATGVARLKDGGFLVVGRTDSYGNGADDFMLLKVSKR